MKISETTLETVKSHAKVETNEDDFLIERIYMPAARMHLAAYTGLDEEKTDEREDMTLAFLALCTYMIDNRSAFVGREEISRVVDSITGKYAMNLL